MRGKGGAAAGLTPAGDPHPATTPDAAPLGVVGDDDGVAVGTVMMTPQTGRHDETTVRILDDAAFGQESRGVVVVIGTGGNSHGAGFQLFVNNFVDFGRVISLEDVLNPSHVVGPNKIENPADD